uniref:Uncharacterized protein n=1 Tax=Parascaris univalens TaxID=6257 RepID=A0A915BU05_PARUN
VVSCRGQKGGKNRHLSVQSHGWPSGLRRQTQVDSFLQASRDGRSGMVIHAWVRIPLRAHFCLR